MQKSAKDPRTTMRRSDKAADDAWIRALLRRAPFGSLATLRDRQPFLNMNLFVYDEQAHCIYLHSAGEGRTRANVEQDERVCFGVSEMGRILPAATA
ncbi:MAG: pyridoxamine 5'-phosphate oxidase family protein, partial [Terriglobia bacterium]